MGYLQTNKQKYSTEAICVTAKYRLFPKKFSIFKPSFIYSRTTHNFVYGSSTSASVSATDTNTWGWL